MIKLKAYDLRRTEVAPEQKAQLKKQPIYIILDNVLDTYNVGAIFRLADAVGAAKIVLSGQTETPPNSRIKKASINTTEWVEWDYEESASKAVEKLKQEVPGIQVVAIEQDPKSVDYTSVQYNFPIALVVGHETDGVSPEVLTLADNIVELPMFGVNVSLNVMVSLGIVLYEIVGHRER